MVIRKVLKISDAFTLAQDGNGPVLCITSNIAGDVTSEAVAHDLRRYLTGQDSAIKHLQAQSEFALAALRQIEAPDAPVKRRKTRRYV